MALCGEGRDAMLTETQSKQTKDLQVKNSFAMRLYAIFTDGDISEEKLKNASGLNIELARFKGYDLDIYSFKTEFEKLIQPTIQKRYWVDILKNNYMAGAAFTLVNNTGEINEIWKRLISAYGNVKLLLQNKIANLDKLDNLEKS